MVEGVRQLQLQRWIRLPPAVYGYMSDALVSSITRSEFTTDGAYGRFLDYLKSRHKKTGDFTVPSAQDLNDWTEQTQMAYKAKSHDVDDDEDEEEEEDEGVEHLDSARLAIRKEHSKRMDPWNRSHHLLHELQSSTVEILSAVQSEVASHSSVVEATNTRSFLHELARNKKRVLASGEMQNTTRVVLDCTYATDCNCGCRRIFAPSSESPAVEDAPETE
jgi:hypothetical protein